MSTKKNQFSKHLSSMDICFYNTLHSTVEFSPYILKFYISEVPINIRLSTIHPIHPSIQQQTINCSDV